MIIITRYHDICMGHRVYGHENKCGNLHGHNYRFYFSIRPKLPDPLDTIGRVIDFSIIKSTLCQWLEDNWDHKFIIFESDPLCSALHICNPTGVVLVPFNPTAENIACYFVEFIAPNLLDIFDVELFKLILKETEKCSATYTKDDDVPVLVAKPDDYSDLSF